MSEKITGTIHWYQDLSEDDQLAYKYGKPENFVYGETGYVLRCQKHAGCPFDNSHTGHCKNGDTQNRIKRGPTEGKLYTAAVVKGWPLEYSKQSAGLSVPTRSVSRVTSADSSSSSVLPKPYRIPDVTFMLHRSCALLKLAQSESVPVSGFHC